MLAKCNEEKRYLGSPESLVRAKGIIWCLLVVSGLGKDGITPPRLNGIQTNRTVLRVLKHEEDEDGRKGGTRVESG